MDTLRPVLPAPAPWNHMSGQRDYCGGMKKRAAESHGKPSGAPVSFGKTFPEA